MMDKTETYHITVTVFSNVEEQIVVVQMYHSKCSVLIRRLNCCLCQTEFRKHIEMIHSDTSRHHTLVSMLV